MLIKLIFPIFFLALLNGCTNIPPQDIPAEIQKNNSVGKLVLATSASVFYVTDADRPDGSPVDRYVTIFSDAIVISWYEYRNLVTKVIPFKDIEKVSFTSGEVSEYYRPKFLVISWTSDTQVNQFTFKTGNTYYAIRLSSNEFNQIKNLINGKGIPEFNMGLAKRVKSLFDAQVEDSINPMAGFNSKR